MEEEKLKLSDYLVACIDFEESQDPEKLNIIQSFVNKVECREYIPLKEKEMIMVKIITSINGDTDAPGASAFFEMSKITMGLLSYCVNVENNVGGLNALYHAYDLMYEFGLVDAILSRCQVDYQRLIKMIDDMINFSNIEKIVQTAALFDQASYDKWEENMKNLKTTLDKAGLTELMAMSMSEDSSVKEAMQTMQQIAVDSVNKEIRDESQRIKNAIEFNEQITDEKKEA